MTYAYNGMNQPIDPRMLSGMGAISEEELKRLRGPMPGGQGWEGASDKLAWMRNNQRLRRMHGAGARSDAEVSRMPMNGVQMAGGGGTSRAELDAKARAMGFASYEQWQAWQTNQDRMRGGPATGVQQGGGFGDTIERAMGWHPAWLLDWVNEKIKGAGQ